MNTLRSDSDSEDNFPDALGALAEQFLSQKRLGQDPDIDDYCERHPELARRITELFPTLVQLERLGMETSWVAQEQVEANGELPDQIGDFKIIREIGRGGMGVVYEAEQQSLGRRVALKVLPAHATHSSTAVERFRRESCAAARLHHSNIVPVFGVGEHEGMHYYVMQYIQGVGLDEVLLRFNRPQTRQWWCAPKSGQSADQKIQLNYWNRVATIGVQLAQALHFAHSNGVLHRDLKPANVLFDVDGAVWLTDFGLAQVTSDLNLTQSGDIVGTLRYLAPERLRGEYSCQSDVYGLGITLYELLTLAPGFGELDRAALIHQILHQEPRRPRSINRDIPRDLETIILKSIEKEPARRYADAAQLADDLSRFLTDRPIHARRVAYAEQTWRWCRRNPLISLLSVSVCLLLCVLLAAWGMFSWVQDDRDRALAAQRMAEQMTKAASRAEADARSRYHYSQAVSYRHSQEPFRKSKGLSEIAKAGTYAPSEEVVFQLRNEAIALLALTDLKSGQDWHNQSGFSIHYDRDFEHQIQLERPGEFLVTSNRGDFAPMKIVSSSSSLQMSMLSDLGQFAVLRDKLNDGLLEVWNVANHKLALGPLQHCWATDISPDETQFAVYQADHAVHFYSLTDGLEVSQFSVGDVMTSLAFSPEGHRVALASEEKNLVQIHECSTGQIIDRVVTEGNVFSCDWHPDGTRLAIGLSEPNDVEMWSVTQPRRLTRMRGHTQVVTQLAFNKFGDHLVSASWDGTLRIWNAMTGDQVSVFTGSGYTHGGHETVIGLRLTDTGLRSVGLDRSDIFSRLANGNDQPMSQFMGGDVDLSDSLFFVATHQGLECWELNQCKLRSRVDYAFPQAVYFDARGARLITGEADGMNEWPIQKHDSGWQIGPSNPLIASETLVRSTCYSNNGRSWAALGDRRLRMMTIEGVLVREFEIPELQNSVTLSPDATIAVTYGWHTPTVCVWNIATGKLMFQFESSQSTQFFTNDSKQLITGRGDDYVFRNTSNWEISRKIARRDCAFAGQVAFTSSGDLVALELEWGMVHLLNTTTYETVAILESPQKARPTRLQFIDSGNTLCCSHHLSGEIHVWRIDALRSELRELQLDWEGEAPMPSPPADSSDCPQRIDFVRHVANEQSEMNSHRQAVALAEKNLAKDPTSLPLANLLAWQLLTGPKEMRDEARAAALLEANSRATPLEVNSRNTLAVAYYRVGKYAQSIALLRENVKKQQDAMLGYDLYFLAMGLWQTGRTEESHEAFNWAERIIRLKPPSPNDRMELDQIRSEASALIGL